MKPAIPRRFWVALVVFVILFAVAFWYFQFVLGPQGKLWYTG